MPIHRQASYTNCLSHFEPTPGARVFEGDAEWEGKPLT